MFKGRIVPTGFQEESRSNYQPEGNKLVQGLFPGTDLAVQTLLEKMTSYQSLRYKNNL